jgi:site-specific DNA-methyltransferase (adenine-specific)
VHEPIILARKPLGEGTVAANVLRHGTGAINVDACRVQTADDLNGGRYSDNKRGDDGATYGRGINLRSVSDYASPAGRWPANVLHDGSPEVLDAFAQFGERSAGHFPATQNTTSAFMVSKGRALAAERHTDTGTAARFYYAAKASKAERAGSKHPTIKPLAVIRWLVRLITPPDGTCLDPFAGSGTTGHAAQLEHRAAMLIEREAAYVADIHRRPQPMPLFEWAAA